MGGERDACVDDERLVLSEVHIGSSAADEEAEVVSRYTYLVPSDRTGDDGSISSSSSSSSSSSLDQTPKHNKRNGELRTTAAAAAATAKKLFLSTQI